MSGALGADMQPPHNVVVEAVITQCVRKAMKDRLIVIATAAYVVALALSSQLAESRTLRSHPGAAIGTPGTENKANPIPVYRGKSIHGGRSAMATTPGEANKGNRRGDS